MLFFAKYIAKAKAAVSQYAVQAIVIIALMGGAFWLGWHEKSLRIPALIEAQKAADAAACTKEQAKTKELNDALIKNRNRIAADAAKYKRLHPNECYNLQGGGQLHPAGDEHAGVHGISTDWLRDYAALSETYRSELDACDAAQ
jgi:hypothetical protein